MTAFAPNSIILYVSDVEASTTFSSERTKSVHDAGADDTNHPHES